MLSYARAYPGGLRCFQVTPLAGRSHHFSGLQDWISNCSTGSPLQGLWVHRVFMCDSLLPQQQETASHRDSDSNRETHCSMLNLQRLCRQGHPGFPVVASEGLCSLKKEGRWVALLLQQVMFRQCTGGRQAPWGSKVGRISWQSKMPRSPPCHGPHHAMCVERQGTACSCTSAILHLSKRIPMPSVISQLPGS